MVGGTQQPHGVFPTKNDQHLGWCFGGTTIWATKKPVLLSIESWLVNRDPYNGLL